MRISLLWCFLFVARLFCFGLVVGLGLIVWVAWVGFGFRLRVVIVMRLWLLVGDLFWACGFVIAPCGLCFRCLDVVLLV